MRIIKKTFLTATAIAFTAVLCLFAVTLVLAACSEKVTLRFETNGGTSLASVEGKVGASYVIPDDPQKEGYYFDGWYLSNDFTGERQELPSTMPKESRTYYAKYAKYPVLTLLSEGGELEKTEHLIKPGVNLTEYLSEFEPKKEGLVFGGWYRGEELLKDGERMTEQDLTLTARYKAKYAVEVFLQNADNPKFFDLSDELSDYGYGWEGSTLAPDFSAPAHFYLDESRDVVKNRILRAGENTLQFYYLRQAVTLTYQMTSPSGERKELREETRYGAHIRLSECLFQADGYEFFGWASEESGPAVLRPNETLTIGAENKTLFSSWAKKYDNVRGKGYLAVEEYADEHIHQTIFSYTSAYIKGTFDDRTQTFDLNGKAGRLDGRGGCLLDDSGKFKMFSLRHNFADERFGSLSLDFLNGRATLVSDGKTVEGGYEYYFDTAQNRYTGQYFFRGENGTGFFFTLDEEDKSFQREGEEKGSFQRFDGQSFSEFEKLQLDGFGRAEYFNGMQAVEGSYHGSGLAEDEWLFESEGLSFRFLIGEKLWRMDGTQVAREKGFLVYDSRLSGSFSGSGTLTLDGYGLHGEYVSASGEKVSGRFTREGNFVNLYAKTALRFTIQGTRFALTGAEAGAYEGELGSLFLDGAGLATLTDASGKSTGGSYRALGQNEFEFTPSAGEIVRFRLKGKGYDVFRPELYGTFTGSYTAQLFLDGYGGGLYQSIDSDSCFEITIGHYDGEFIQILSENLKTPRYFKIEAGRELILLQGAAVGKYFIYCGGEKTDDYLFLYEKDRGKFVSGGKTVYGSYHYDAVTKEVIFSTAEGEETYRLLTIDGVSACILFRGKSVYTSGNERLELDGYEGATYQSGATRVTGRYELTPDGVDLFAENKLLRFVLGENAILSVTEFTRYSGEAGTLYLQKSGDGAIFHGDKTLFGSYAQGRFYDENGEYVFSFKLVGSEYLIFDEDGVKTLSIKDGGTLFLDGCGGGILTRGDLTATGSVELRENLIIFRSEQLNTVSCARAFVLSGDMLEALGEEFGEYECGEKMLMLDGNGFAVYCGIRGSYVKVQDSESEFLFTGGGTSFRFRLVKKGGRPCFERYNSLLAAFAGEYQTSLGTIVVSAYSISLHTEAGETELEILCASLEGVIVQNASGDCLGILFGDFIGGIVSENFVLF